MGKRFFNLYGGVTVPGGGANYVHQHWQEFFTDLTAAERAVNRRVFPWPALGRRILEAEDPPVRCIVVTRSNPVTQVPETAAVLRAFRRAGFRRGARFLLLRLSLPGGESKAGLKSEVREISPRLRSLTKLM